MATAKASTETYIPGVCNINRTEIAYRRKAGYAGVVISLVVAAPLLLLDVSRLWRLVVALPVFLAALGFLQAQQHFCVSYAASGKQNTSDQGMQGAAMVSKAADRLADKLKARRMYLQAGGIGIVVAALLLLVPHV